jgi:hypothetical protein
MVSLNKEVISRRSDTIPVAARYSVSLRARAGTRLWECSWKYPHGFQTVLSPGLLRWYNRMWGEILMMEAESGGKGGRCRTGGSN